MHEKEKKYITALIERGPILSDTIAHGPLNTADKTHINSRPTNKIDVDLLSTAHGQ